MILQFLCLLQHFIRCFSLSSSLSRECRNTKKRASLEFGPGVYLPYIERESIKKRMLERGNKQASKQHQFFMSLHIILAPGTADIA
jgi:hypothetical protein